MAICITPVTYEEYNPRTGNIVVFKGKCGDWLMLRKRLCTPCTVQATQQYPQGWLGYPGDTCKHGVYVGGCMEDFICGTCEWVDKS